ncbi:MAG: Nif3-like dinuclear metal center hexameric protein [Oscillospiraceae bacterium]|nr:Nif3-like dinuclear metal center hexameric protein [Oscillospiraceae bacterium]
MRIKQINDYINKIAPYNTQMSFDNAGFLAGDINAECNTALVCLDITPRVIKEAVELGAELIVSHHPIIFSPLKSVTAGSIAYLLIKNNLAAICAHTNLDMASGGVNDALAEAIGLQNIRPIIPEHEQSFYKLSVFVPKGYEEAVRKAAIHAGAGTLGAYSGCSFESEGCGRFTPLQGANPHQGTINTEEEAAEVKLELLCPPDLTGEIVRAVLAAHPYETPAYDLFVNEAVKQQSFIARIGTLKCDMFPNEFAYHVKSSLNAAAVTYTQGKDKIKTVAVCGGSGAEYWPKAKALGADAFLTGESKHHQQLEAAEAEFTLVTAGHYETEHPIAKKLSERLQNQFPEVRFMASAQECSPIKGV